MITQLLSKIFGTANKRELNRLQPMVEQINVFEPSIKKLSDEQLREKTNEFRQRYQDGEKFVEGVL